MSFSYEPQGWQAPARQSSWEQPPPPSRSGASSTSQREDGNAFATQFEEVDRAIDNLVKSGKFFPGGPRRDSMPMMAMGRQYQEYGHRMHGGGGGGRHSVSEFDPSRGSASNMQNFYANQRYQAARQDNPDQIMQAKRRMAAQRERELRNYHQEQQYNRSVLAEMASNKSDRSGSPSGISEEGRRDLIARQHRALYGNDGTLLNPSSGYSDDNAREQSGTTPIGAPRGPSPRATDPFGPPGQGPAQDSAQEQPRSDKPVGASGQPTFGGFDQAGTSNSAAGDDGGHSRQLSKSTTAPVTGGMAPIGSRPNPQNQNMNKRTTSPMPSSLGYGFGTAEQHNERSNSSNSNNNAPKEGSTNAGMGAWGTGSGVWGSNKIGATSVWG